MRYAGVGLQRVGYAVDCFLAMQASNTFLGTEVGVGPGHIVLHGDQAPPKGAQPPNFRPVSVVTKRLDGSRCHLVRICLSPGDIALDGDPARPPPCLLWPNGW